MSPSIDLTDEIFSRLQKHAVPLIDTPITVIGRALDALEAGPDNVTPPPRQVGPQAFNPAAPPNLSHTTPRRAQIDGSTLSKADAYWNPILYAVIDSAGKKGVTADDLLELLTVPSVKGKKEGNGYNYISAAGISVQGQNANNAWKQAYRIASSIGIDVQVVFVWQDTPKAAMPGVTGSFFIEG